MQLGKLFVVATPIGNLGDFTIRATETLRDVDLIYCEDTRQTQKLLEYLGFKKPLRSYHQHSKGQKFQEILSELQAGKNLALVTDAGTPGISDPGGELVEHITENNEEITIVPVPGPSAVIAALSVCGFPADKFLFLGFPPHKNKRQKFFEEVANFPYTVVFYESPYRIKKALQSLEQFLGSDRRVCVCREVTKKFETLYRGTITEIVQKNIPEKGEFVVVIEAR